jgi:hypothetical protein
MDELASYTTDLEIIKTRSWKDVAAIINSMIWAWYDEQHDMNRVLFTIRKWGIINFTVRVHHLESIFTYIFGKPSVG